MQNLNAKKQKTLLFCFDIVLDTPPFGSLRNQFRSSNTTKMQVCKK